MQFLLIVERGPLEAQAVLLCESIRAFAGRHADAAIVAISPRPCRRPARALALGGQFLRHGEQAESEAFAANLRARLKHHGPAGNGLLRRAAAAFRDRRLASAIRRRLLLQPVPAGEGWR